MADVAVVIDIVIRYGYACGALALADDAERYAECEQRAGELLSEIRVALATWILTSKGWRAGAHADGGLLDARRTLACRRLAYRVQRALDRHRPYLRQMGLGACGLEEGP